MKQILVWDFPVRISHALLALLFAGAFGLATLAPERSTLFTLHAAFGLVAIFVVFLRVVWAFVGPRTARGFDLRPAALLAHLKGGAARPAGHNPGTSWFALAMGAALVALGHTGYRLGRGDERPGEVHETLAWVAAGLVVLHLAGLLVHRLRHGENLATSMATGRRAGEAAHAIPSARPIAGAAFLLLVAAWGAVVARGTDRGARRVTFPLTGEPLAIGETEEHDEDASDHEGDHDDDERKGEGR